MPLLTLIFAVGKPSLLLPRPLPRMTLPTTETFRPNSADTSRNRPFVIKSLSEELLILPAVFPIGFM